MSIPKTKDIVVLYHGGCPDGFGGAWAAWKHFGKRASYVPLSRQESPPFHLKDKTLYFVDFVYSLHIMKKFMAQNKRVTAIDHHVSGEKVTKMTEQPLYAVNHSGAVLAWKYFHPNEPTPRILRYIEDEDIWKFVLPHTKEVNVALSLREPTFQVWSKFARLVDTKTGRKEIIRNGRLLLAFQEGIIKRLAENAEPVLFHGILTYAVNAPEFFSSKVGHVLYTKLPPLAIIWNRSRGNVRVSLRSNKAVDVSKIAQEYGGGGHRGAGGFVLPAGKKLPWRYISAKRHASSIKSKRK